MGGRNQLASASYKSPHTYSPWIFSVAQLVSWGISVRVGFFVWCWVGYSLFLPIALASEALYPDCVADWEGDDDGISVYKVSLLLALGISLLPFRTRYKHIKRRVPPPSNRWIIIDVAWWLL